MKDKEEEDKRKKYGIALRASSQEKNIDKHIEDEELDEIDKKMMSLFSKKYKKLFNKFNSRRS